MAYNLPPPWDSGYALPSNVRDEGLVRRAFVTKQMPRGTYDQPNVGTGGYAVPQYVMDEGYGQGTLTTKWRPRGTYDLPVPHWLDRRTKVLAEAKNPGGGTKVTFDALSGTELPRLYTDFGGRAAKAVLERVMAVPAGSRKQLLKTILDRIDPTLWKRVAELAAQIQRTGVSAGAALYPALAQAMSAGIAAEVVQAGLRRSVPQPRSLLGLGCRYALGAFDQLATASKYTAAIEGPKMCAPPAGYTWDVTGTTPYLRRLKAGETPKEGPCGTTVDTRTGGAATVEDSKDQTGKFMVVGPSKDREWFKLRVKDSGEVVAGTFSPGVTISNEIWQDAIAQMRKQSTKLVAQRALAKAAPPTMVDTADYGLGPGKIAKDVVTGKFPIYKFTWPEGAGSAAGKPFAVMFNFKGVGAQNAYVWTLTFQSVSKEWYESFWDGLTGLVSWVVDFAKEAVEAVADLACKVATSPIGGAAGAAGATAAGAPPEAGVAGATIARGVCSGSGPPPGTVVMPPTSNSIVPLAIAGGLALVAVVVLKRKKKAP